MRSQLTCRTCGDAVPQRRWELGYRLCLPCGDAAARQERASWCIAPMHKSNYMLMTSREDLQGINNKGGLVR
jgi:hypothetical protein